MDNQIIHIRINNFDLTKQKHQEENYLTIMAKNGYTLLTIIKDPYLPLYKYYFKKDES